MTTLTERQQEIKTRLDDGKQAREIAEELGISRNAVYQQIQRLRRYGVLEAGWTPTGLPARETPGERALAALLDGADDGDASVSGALALIEELRRTRDDLDSIARRLSRLLPR